MLRILSIVVSASAQEWPLHFAESSIEILEADGLEPEDPHRMHLHTGHHSAAESHAVTLRVNIFRALHRAGAGARRTASTRSLVVLRRVLARAADAD